MVLPFALTAIRSERPPTGPPRQLSPPFSDANKPNGVAAYQLPPSMARSLTCDSISEREMVVCFAADLERTPRFVFGAGTSLSRMMALIGSQRQPLGFHSKMPRLQPAISAPVEV